MFPLKVSITRMEKFHTPLQTNQVESGSPNLSKWLDPLSGRSKLIGLMAVTLAILVHTPAFLAQGVWNGDLQGTVVDASTQSPVPNAQIQVQELDKTLYADENGQFQWEDIPLPEVLLPVTVVVTADGYGEWRIEGVPLRAADTLILNVKLGPEPILIQMPDPRQQAPGEYRRQDILNLQDSLIIGPPYPQLPETITVRVFGPPYSPCDPNRTGYEDQVIDFKQYAKHVLPNEWVNWWPWESLRAGAMAVKTFGWFWVLYPGSWDVRDDVCDQVYNPAVEYATTNLAVDFTWNWRMTRGGYVFLIHYLDHGWRCDDYGWEDCMGQYDTYYHSTGNSGYDKLTWDEMLLRYYSPAEITDVVPPLASGYSLRFYGNGWGDIDRVKVPIDPHVPADADGDFTLEWWMKADPTENLGAPCSTGSHENWIKGNTIFDRDVYGSGDHGDYGVSLAGGKIAFGINNGSQSLTLCGSAVAADNRWHHVAVTRESDGSMAIFFDGRLDASGTGPVGAISYRDGRTSSYPDSDPFLVIGAEKHDAGPSYPSYSGWLDEIRLSSVVRYVSDFTPPNAPFVPDGDTLALYHLDEGFGNLIGDSSGNPGGPSNGIRNYGGNTNGPEWYASDLLFLSPRLYFPLINR